MDYGVLIHLLEISIVLIFFVNKVLVLSYRRFGWSFGIIAAILAMGYFYFQGKYPMMVMQAGIFAVSVYGFVGQSKKEAFELPVRIIVIAILMALAVAVVKGNLELPKSIPAAGILLANYSLARSNFRTGWSVLCVCNIVAAYLGYVAQHFFFADFQMATAILASIGVISSMLKEGDYEPDRPVLPQAVAD